MRRKKTRKPTREQNLGPRFSQLVRQKNKNKNNKNSEKVIDLGDFLS